MTETALVAPLGHPFKALPYYGDHCGVKGCGQPFKAHEADLDPAALLAIRLPPLPEWCGAGHYTPAVAEDGRIVAESRRMCGLKEPHEWHQDRYDASFRWKSLPPFAERDEPAKASP